MYISRTINNKLVIAFIVIKAYIIEDLKAKLLINNNILVL